MSTASRSSSLFSRNLRKDYPVAVRGEGCWIIDANGRRYLDASGQAAVVSIGHGVPEIGRAMAEQSNRIAFAHTTQFHSESAEKLAARVLAIAREIFRMAAASTSPPAAPKPPKPPSNSRASISSKPISLRGTASFPASRATTAAPSAPCPSAATSAAALLTRP